MKTISVDRIKLARESRGLTQTSMAQQLSFNQATLSKIEKGLYHVNEEMINEIASVLDYKKDFFYKSHEVYPLKHFYFRKNLGTTVTNSKKIESIINIFSSNIIDLAESVDIKVDLPYIDLEKEETTPEAFALLVRQYFNLPIGPIKNFVNILEKQGVVVHFFDFNKDLKISGVSFITPDGIPLIIINNSIPNSRKRFTLAHELAHLLMHYKGGIIDENRDLEKEADRFASEFLVPTKEIKKYLFNLTEQNLFALKSYWKVSIQAIIYKANKNGAMTLDQHRRWITKINYNGWRKVEPFEFEIEPPSLLPKLFELHFNDLEYSIEEIQNMFGLNNDEFYRCYIQNYPQLHSYFPKLNRSKLNLKLT
ncbi:Zn-dependent peptidase ImmA (M78 family)/DNA-binding XRE family transcriptional regulator [Chryseobacterium sp. H1D6B]|uniref:XRE family transcriptional regulator n=1 Tax=Chryseobacterium sp. H1D6B TaxID=2940588 RepID=UPI0015CC7515|nr:XRE family transcriptional regulator [Chryseobacterium sp. H1D6B]MDH6250986.1 Zn-dependent peptidase ImmA (M78 family)/DNA-binding XRE family transcriptional regulator [Chryseobacterium sp. H1D6B]